MTASLRSPRPRFAMLEGIRGIGALAIASYHINRYGPFPEIAAPLIPAPIQYIVDHGWMAVQWFFVVAGFSLAYLLLDVRLQAADLWRIARRRTLRLGIAYWFTVLFAVALTLIAILGLDDRSFNEQLPTWDQVLAHLLFLHDIIDYENLTTGIWFLAIDVQIGLVFLLLLFFAQTTAAWRGADAIRPPGWILMAWFAPLSLYSLFFSIHDSATDMWFYHFFCLPMLGAVTCWTLHQRLNPWTAASYFALFALQICFDFSIEVTNALIAALTIYLAGRLQRLDSWLSHPLLQYLGRISYSLFLIHYPISWIVETGGAALSGNSPLSALFWLVTSLVASVGAAHLLYTFVERPGLEWARRLH